MPIKPSFFFYNIGFLSFLFNRNCFCDFDHFTWYLSALKKAKFVEIIATDHLEIFLTGYQSDFIISK